MFNGIERFFIEKIRVNNKFEVLGIQATQAEIIAILFVLTGAIMLWYLKKEKKGGSDKNINRVLRKI